MSSKEEVYDAEINPLMAKIIEICQENGINMMATFSFGDGELCTTLLAEDGQDPDGVKLVESLRQLLFPAAPESGV